METQIREVVKKFFDSHPLSEFVQNSYDDFLDNGILEVLRSNPIEVGCWRIEFTNVYIMKPTTEKISLQSSPMYPYQARDIKSTYESSVLVEIRVLKKEAGKYVLYEEYEEYKNSEDYQFRIYMFTIPMMLGSKYCNLNPILNNVQKLADVNECVYDPLSYFIINGNEKILVSQEKLKLNKIMIIQSSKGINAEIRSAGSNGNVKETKMNIFMSKKNKRNTKTIKRSITRVEVSLQFVRDGKLNITSIFRLYGIIDAYNNMISNIHPIDFANKARKVFLMKAREIDSDVVDIKRDIEDILILSERGYSTKEILHQLYELQTNTKKMLVNDDSVRKRRKIKHEIMSTDIGAEIIMQLGELEGDLLNKSIDKFRDFSSKSMSSRKLSSLVDDTINEERIMSDESTFINNVLSVSKIEGVSDIVQIVFIFEKNFDINVFPHINTGNDHKLRTFITMMSRLGRCYIGDMPADDRDHYGNKMVEHPGMLLKSQFSKLYKYGLKRISMREQTIKYTAESIHRFAKDEIKRLSPLITNGILDAMKTGKWGLKGPNQREGVAQLLSRLSLIGIYSHLRRISVPVNKNQKQTKPRMIHPSQYKVICPSETPEGESCGVVKNMSVSSYITTAINSESIESVVSEFLTSVGDAIYINERFVGHGDIKVIRKHLVSMRRCGKFHPYTSIFIDTIPSMISSISELYVSTEEGRLVSPYFVVEDGELLIVKKDMFKHEYSFDDLVSNGVVEYMDANEIEQGHVLVAGNYKKITSESTHAEIDESFIVSVTSALLPFTEHAPNPRLTYSASMIKQAQGTTMTSYNTRADMGLKITHHNEKPFVQTYIQDIIGLNNIPTGINVSIAMMPYGGFNQEDSLIFNRKMFDLGAFRSTTYSLFPVEISKTADYREVDRKNPNLHKGIIKTGTKVNYMDTIGVRMRKNIKSLTNRKTSNNDEVVPEDIKMKDPRSGIIDDVFVGTMGKNANITTSRVKIRFPNLPKIGDKYASRYGQKGTIGMVYSDENMPFRQTGQTVSVIINPASIPSRMTIGQLMEMLIGKASASYDKTRVVKYFKDFYIPVWRLTNKDQTLVDDEDTENITGEQVIRLSKFKGRDEYLKIHSEDILAVRHLVEGDAGKNIRSTDEKIMDKQYYINTRKELESMKDGTIFKTRDIRDTSKLLRDMGYHSQGHEMLTSGMTGEPIEAEIFTGICYYSALKHMVKDKIQARRKGAVDLIKRQPVSGRARGGGLRSGEMERDCLIAHGAAHILNERFMTMSDPFRTQICKTCGKMCYEDTDAKQYICARCGPDSDPAEVTIPYSFKLYMQYMQSIGIDILCDVKLLKSSKVKAVIQKTEVNQYFRMGNKRKDVNFDNILDQYENFQ
jgi:DNA-directed RNA polymerase beta subunit